MSAKMVTIPFDLETAKKIMSGERKGAIVTKGYKCNAEIVYQDEKRRSIRPILAVIHSPFGPVSDWIAEDGVGMNLKLVLEVPEYTTYKDGDLLKNREGDYLFVLNTNGSYLTSYHVSMKIDNTLHFSHGNNNCAANINNIELYDLADEDDKKRMIEALKASDDPEARTCLKKFFGIEEYDFEPFSKVLVRDDVNEEWHISFFARMIRDGEIYKFECSNGAKWNYCIPFKGNEDLLTPEKTE